MHGNYSRGSQWLYAVVPLMALFSAGARADALLPIEEYRPLLERTTCTGECDTQFNGIELHLKRVQVDEKGTPAFIISPNDLTCGKQGCVALFMKRQKKWEQLIEYSGTMEIAPSRSNGMADVIISFDHHEHGLRQIGREIFKWNGKRYAVASHTHYKP